MTGASPHPKGSARLTRAERYDAGRTRRNAVPRECHAECRLSPSRDPIAVLHAADRVRIPELVPERYRRMAQSPFAFLRGAAAVMAKDLASLPMAGIPVQACGDCHLMNFGVFTTPEERLLFDINDFDETYPGVDFTVDLKRLVASVAVAALDMGLNPEKARALAGETASAYREFILELAAKTPIEIWHARTDVAREIKRISDVKLREKVLSILTKTKKNPTADDNFPHLAKVKGGRCEIEDRPPRIYHFDVEGTGGYKINRRALFAGYRASLLPERRKLIERFELADLAIKVVGVGSVGTFCAIGLFVTADGEPVFLQVKQALHSVLENLAAPLPEPAHQGNRVVQGQRALQAASDIFLGWTEDPKTKRQFYVRQLKNRRLGAISELMEGRALGPYAGLCARTLARAHARTGEPAVLAGYMGKSKVFDEALASFAIAYAAQSAQDHSKLTAAASASSALAAG